MQNCKYTYIGEIGRRFDTRLSEHQKETKRVESKKQNYMYTRASRKRSQSELSRGGGVLSPKSYVDVPAGPRKSDYLYTNF